jgi:hypothetical protein
MLFSFSKKRLARQRLIPVDEMLANLHLLELHTHLENFRLMAIFLTDPYTLTDYRVRTPNDSTTTGCWYSRSRYRGSKIGLAKAYSAWPGDRLILDFDIHW